VASIDRWKTIPSIVVLNADTDGQRKRTSGENNKRTERYLVTVTAQVDISVAGTGLRNRGSVLGTLSDVGYIDGGADKYVSDARLARFIGEAMAPSALPATRLAGAGIQAATQLRETFPLWLASPRSINPNDTKYVEPNKQLAQELFITPQRTIGRLVAGAPTGTVTNQVATVEQVYDDLVGTPPLLTTYVRQITQNVPGANAAMKIDLRGSRYIRGLAIQQDSSDAGEVADIINNLVLRGDNQAIIGDRAVSWRDLVEHSQEEYGGAVVATLGMLFIDFQRYGRLTALWNPYQDTNLRLELDVQPSALSATNSLVRVAVVEFERTAVTVPDLVDGQGVRTQPTGLP
jgi:hypothetical protein